jgi:hypothetical protein
MKQGTTGNHKRTCKRMDTNNYRQTGWKNQPKMDGVYKS